MCVLYGFFVCAVWLFSPLFFLFSECVFPLYVVLDLDETLVHTTHYEPSHYDLAVEVPNRRLPYRTFFVKKRPYLDLFLQQVQCCCSVDAPLLFAISLCVVCTCTLCHLTLCHMHMFVSYAHAQMSKHFDIVVYTASLREYADPVLDLLDSNGVITRRYFREVT